MAYVMLCVLGFNTITMKEILIVVSLFIAVLVSMSIATTRHEEVVVESPIEEQEVQTSVFIIENNYNEYIIYQCVGLNGLAYERASNLLGKRFTFEKHVFVDVYPTRFQKISRDDSTTVKEVGLIPSSSYTAVVERAAIKSFAGYNYVSFGSIMRIPTDRAHSLY